MDVSNVTGGGSNSQNAKGVAGLLRTHQHMSFLPKCHYNPSFADTAYRFVYKVFWHRLEMAMLSSQ